VILREVIIVKQIVTALFDTTTEVDKAIQSLEDLGYTKGDLSVITKQTSVDLNQNKTKVIQDGATTGGVVGGLIGLLTGIGILAIPGIGALFIAGPISTMLGLTGTVATTASGLMSGALAGGIIGAFKSLGVDEIKAKIMEDRIKNGDILLVVECDNEADIYTIKDTLEENGGQHIYEFDVNK
jgi:hypothetical protein